MAHRLLGFVLTHSFAGRILAHCELLLSFMGGNSVTQNFPPKKMGSASFAWAVCRLAFVTSATEI